MARPGPRPGTAHAVIPAPTQLKQRRPKLRRTSFLSIVMSSYLRASGLALLIIFEYFTSSFVTPSSTIRTYVSISLDLVTMAVLLLALLPFPSLATSYVDLYAPNSVPLLIEANTLYRFRASFKPFQFLINATTESTGSFSLYEAGKAKECRIEGYSGVCRQGVTGETLEVRECVDWVEVEMREMTGKRVVVETKFGEATCQGRQGEDTCYTRAASSCLSPCSCGLLTCQSSRATGALPLFTLCLPANTTIEDQLKICQSARFSITWNFTICPELVPVEVQEKLYIVPIVSQACLGVLGAVLLGLWGVHVVQGKQGWATALLPDCLFRRN